MALQPNTRSRLYYWSILVLPMAAFTMLAATGRWHAIWQLFRQPFAPPPHAFDDAFTTAIVWTLATLPVTLTAWNLGRRHTAARRLNYELFIGLRDVVRRALGREPSAEQIEALTRPPKDRIWIAALIGVAVAVLVPLFFMSFAPPLRTRSGAIWVVGAGVILGGLAYCQRRGGAYLVDEPRYFDIFRQYRLLNPQRYEERGRLFVRAQIVCVIILPIWWLGGGSIAFRS